MAKSLITAAKTAAELSVLLAQETQAHETAHAEYIQLAAQDSHVARQGVEALGRHRQLKLDAELRRDVAKARADELREQLTETQKREAEQARQVRYDAHLKGRGARQDRYLKDVSSAYEALFAALEAAKAEQDETTAINKELPAGAKPIEHFEAPMRHTPATPDRREMVEVQRPKEIGGSRVIHGVGHIDTRPTETVKEERVVLGSGTRERRPPPLWDLIELPPLDRSNKRRRVAGTHAPADILKFA